MTNRQIDVRTVLNLYVQLPDTSRRYSLRDRALADHFFDRQIPIDIVETALWLGSARRIFRYPALAPIHSLAYFESIVEQLAPSAPPDDRHAFHFKIQSGGGMEDADAYDPEPPF